MVMVMACMHACMVTASPPARTHLCPRRLRACVRRERVPGLGPYMEPLGWPEFQRLANNDANKARTR